MTIRHHISDDLLMAYSAGQLPEAFSLVVAAHISMCDECRAKMVAFDAVGGAVVEDCGPVPMRPDSLESLLSRLDGLVPEARPARQRSGVFPSPLRDYVGGDLEAVKWRPVGMGVRQAILPTEKDATARLLFIPAGQAMPDHGHGGMELTLVLQGAFVDDGERFDRGDVEVADVGTQHTPVAAEGADCICLAATDAPLRFNGLLPRIAQPFLRI